MTYSPRWRKAMILSIIVHILFLGIVGWLAGSFFAAMESEPYIELELLTDVSMEDSDSDAMPAAKSAPQAAKNETMQAIKSNAKLSDAPKVVAAAEDLAVVAVDEAAVFPAASTNDSDSNSSTATASGGSGNGNGENDKDTAAGSGSGSGNGSGKKGSIIRPRILSKVEPKYPESARQAGQEGTAVVRIQILANGLPGEVTIDSTSGYAVLDDAAVAAVQKWQFIPAKNPESGANIMCRTTMPVSFRLK
jgi:protein TonB